MKLTITFYTCYLDTFLAEYVCTKLLFSKKIVFFFFLETEHRSDTVADDVLMIQKTHFQSVNLSYCDLTQTPKTFMTEFR